MNKVDLSPQLYLDGIERTVKQHVKSHIRVAFVANYMLIKLQNLVAKGTARYIEEPFERGEQSVQSVLEGCGQIHFLFGLIEFPGILIYFVLNYL